MKISSFTKPELDTFREQCNFTEIERQCFDLKARVREDAMRERRVIEDVIRRNLLVVAEVCFESEPSPLNWTWKEKLESHLVSHEVKKNPKSHTKVTPKLTVINTN